MYRPHDSFKHLAKGTCKPRFSWIDIENFFVICFWETNFACLIKLHWAHLNIRRKDCILYPSLLIMCSNSLQSKVLYWIKRFILAPIGHFEVSVLLRETPIVKGAFGYIFIYEDTWHTQLLQSDRRRNWH